MDGGGQEDDLEKLEQNDHGDETIPMGHMPANWVATGVRDRRL